MSNEQSIVFNEHDLVCKVSINQKTTNYTSTQLKDMLKSFIDFQFKHTYLFSSVNVRFYNSNGEPMD